MTTINELISGLNARKLYSGKDKEGRTFLTVQDDNGDAHFINRTAVVGADGNRVQENGKDVFVWVLGAKLQARPVQPELPLNQ